MRPIYNFNPKTALDVVKNLEAVNYDRDNPGTPYVQVYDARNLYGRVVTFGGVFLLLGILGGALYGAQSHSPMVSILSGAVGAGAVGAALGALWHLLITGVGAILRIPLLGGPIKGAVVGAAAGLALAAYNGVIQHPAPTVAALAVVGGVVGVLWGLRQMRPPHVIMPKRTVAPPPWEKRVCGADPATYAAMAKKTRDSEGK